MAPCPDTPLRLRRQSGSTRHDAVIAVSEPQYWPRLPLGLARPRRRSPWKTLWRLKIASVHTAGLLSCRCSPASATPKREKLSARTTVLGAPRHRRALQIPIAADKLLPRSALHPAISCPGAFRTPAVGARGWLRHAGIRKPAQGTSAVETATKSSCRRIAENRRKADLKKACEIQRRFRFEVCPKVPQMARQFCRGLYQGRPCLAFLPQ